jgi:hypothetical protein
MFAIVNPATPIVRPRITTVSSAQLGAMLDQLNESYTFERLTGAVEHRAWDGQLVAVSINGKHYVNRDDDLPSPVKLVQ